MTQPVEQARKITELLTDDLRIQNRLLGVITRELTVDEINKIYEKIKYGILQ